MKAMNKRKFFNPFSSLLKVAALAVLSTMCLACVSNGNPPTTLMTQAQERVTVAKSHGAQEYAPVALENAQDYINKAKQNVEDGDYEKAQQHLQIAMAKSDYAIIKSDAEKTEKSANQISEDLMTLQREALE